MIVQDIYTGALSILGKEEGPFPSSFIDRVPSLLNVFFPYLNDFREEDISPVGSLLDEVVLSTKELSILIQYLALQMAVESDGISEAKLGMINGNLGRLMGTLSTGIVTITPMISGD